ncbi:hypothetical protein TRFO_12698 [Tritrichomonas foetus]|uniref:CNH domain-containing protein n=1 Tax=Tritrichomonas foetus TaxID=1144522 RepID=A0A1J4L0S0_9EUKA|nr:hypothetical protein TRFO_12698 [Tritrichomonas foetus]|eukprot:OHT17010.1 hypothetical protein TRFO_12698 [Tritrichomonas foetus]
MSSSLSHAQPPLLSLNVRRTVDAIIEMDTEEAQSVIAQPLIPKPTKDESAPQDHQEEIKAIHEILEQQCFAFVAFHNHIKDAREVQMNQMKEFQTRANSIASRIQNLSSTLFNKVHELNHRIDIIQRTLAPKPIFRKLLPPNEFGRITGINTIDNFISLTTATGHLIILDRENFEIIETFQPLPNESLFFPSFIRRQNNIIGLFCVTSNRNLFFSTPVTNPPSNCFKEKVECYAVADNSNAHSAFDVVLGHHQFVNFCLINTENSKEIISVGTTKNLRGTVTHIVVDDDHDAVYLLTSKRYYYSISASTFQTITSTNFQNPLMQIALTRIFIVVSCAPNDIILAERNREKFNQIYRFDVSAGLRRLCTSDKSLFVITKKQQIEKRTLSKPLESQSICEPEAADYDPREYIGAIHCDGSDIYLAHGNRISLWI